MNPKSGRTWISFKDLRSKLKFEEVLKYYGVELRLKGSQHQGPCPLPGHGGDRTLISFSANMEKGIFNCFGCGGSGNVLDFAALMEQVDVRSGMAVRKVAVKIQAELLGKREVPQKSVQTELPVAEESARVNAPLDFELKDLDPTHERLAKVGFDGDTIRQFGAGYCSRGSLKGRVAVPLYDLGGKLIGYAGIDMEADHGRRYSFPTDRERNGVALKFDRSRLLYNAHRIKAPADVLFVLQSFEAVWWLRRHGIEDAIAVVASSASDDVIKAITDLSTSTGRVCVVQESETGGPIAESLVASLRTVRFARLTVLKGRRGVVGLSKEELAACLNF